MESLPEKPLIEIVNHLKNDYFQQIFQMRLINKHWNKCINKINIEKLILIDETNEFENSDFPTYEPIDLKNIILSYNVSNFFHHNESTREIFKNLKYLKINFLTDLENLNHFQKLENLQIETDQNLVQFVNLNLIQLRVLKFNQSDSSETTQSKLNKLIINSENLKFLYCKLISRIELKNPKTLIHLEMDKFDENVVVFENLEILKYNKLHTKDTTVTELKLLSKLKEIYFFFMETFYKDKSKWEKIFNDILIQQEKALKHNPNLQFYFHNVKMFKGCTFDSLGLSCRDDFEYVFEYPFISGNLKIISKSMPTLTYIDYCEFEYEIGHLIEELSLNRLADLFNNVQTILALAIDNVHLFVKFLSICRVLSTLEIHKSNSSNSKYIDQEFFDTKFTNYHLKKFIFLAGKRSAIDFKFLLKFKLLKTFETNLHVQISLILELLKNLKFLKHLEFKNEGKLICIEKSDKNLYNVSVGKKRNIVLSKINIGKLRDQIYSIGKDVDYQ